MSCKICKANSHKENNCPKKPKVEEVSSGGRGLTKGNKGDLVDLNVCIGRVDHDALFDEGAKSLVGGFKGKPSGLKDISIRIDRQSKGNVQFQKSGVSLAKVTFSAGVDALAIFNGLRLSLATGEEVNL